MNKRAVLLPLVVLALGGALALLGKGRGSDAPGPAPHGPRPAADEGEAPAAAPGEVPQPVQVRTIPRLEALPAAIHSPVPPVVLRSPVRAPILEIVKEGDAVAEGDLLARMNPKAWEEDLRAAEEKGDGERIARAREQLAGMEVRAPVDGVVFRVNARLAEFPPRFQGEPRPFVILFDWRGMRLRATAPATLAEFLPEGAPVGLRLEGGLPFAGVVVSSGPAAGDGTLPVEARAIAPPPAAPEEGARGEILVRTGTREILTVPGRAIRTRGPLSFVRVHQVAGEPVEREVTVLERFDDGTVQVQGLGRFESVMVGAER